MIELKDVRKAYNQGRDADGGWLSHVRLGYNYRMSDIQAALGLAQLSRIDEILAKRAQVARWYDERLSAYDWLEFQKVPAGASKSWFVYVVKLGDEYGQSDRDAILAGLRDQNIGCNNYFTPVHMQPFIQERLGCGQGDFPVTETVAERTIALPFFGTMQEQEVDAVCEAFVALARNGSRQKASS